MLKEKNKMYNFLVEALSYLSLLKLLKYFLACAENIAWLVIALIKFFIIKEQRIDGSYIMTRFVYKSSMLRYILMGFERNYQIRIRSKKINRQKRY